MFFGGFDLNEMRSREIMFKHLYLYERRITNNSG